MNRRAVVATSIAAAAALAGAAPILGQVTHPGGAASAGGEVTINDAGYIPEPVVVAPGRHIVWTNIGVNPHTVTADDGSFDSGTMGTRAKFELTAPATAGTYTYHCTFHTFMRGTLVVSTISLQGPKKVLAGKAATVRGVAPGGVPGTPVTIEAFASGAWTPVASTTLAADGSFRVATPALKATSSLRARLGDGISPTLDVPVSPKVTITRKGTRSIAVRVVPAKAGKAVLERLNIDTFRWVVAKRTRITAKGRATIAVPRAEGRYRVTVLAAKGLESGTSSVLAFRKG
jgi:plastocyanin